MNQNSPFRKKEWGVFMFLYKAKFRKGTVNSRKLFFLRLT